MSDQLSLFDLLESEDYATRMKKMLNMVVIENGLPQDSLRMIAREYSDGKNSEPLDGYSVQIFEPQYPLPTSGSVSYVTKPVLAMVVEKKGRRKDLVRIMTRVRPIDIPSDVEKADVEKEKTIKLWFNQEDKRLIEFVRANVEYVLKYYTSSAGDFGCCSQQSKCLEKGHCLHENLLYSTGCMTRNNLLGREA